MEFPLGAAVAFLFSLVLPSSAPWQNDISWDSAGITIVQHRYAAEALTAFRVSPDPFIDVGGAGRSALHDFAGVTAAFTLRDGRLVVANSRPPELRVFGRGGRALTLIGEKGQGLGELASENFSVVRRTGDSLLSFDPLLKTIFLFTSQGSFVRSWSIENWSLARSVGGTGLLRAGTFRDGSIVFRQPLADSQAGFTRDSVRLFRVSRDGTVLASFGDFVGGGARTLVPFRPPPDAVGIYGTFAAVANEPVTRPDWLLVDGNRLLYMDDRSNELRIHAADGRLERIVRLSGPGVYSRPAPPRRPGEQRVSLGFMTDDFGRIWIEDYRAPQDLEHRWTVIDRNGHLIGSAVTPRRLQILHIGLDRIVGVRRDRGDREHVQVFRLSRVSPRS